MGRVVQANEAESEETPIDHDHLDTASIDGDSIHIQRLDAIGRLHGQLQRFWNLHEAQVRHVWQAMPIERRRELYQIIKPEQHESGSSPYLMINGHKIPTTNMALIPELSLDYILENLLDMFSSWALNPKDIVAWESLKYVRFCLQTGKVKPKPDDDKEGFCFILGDKFGQFAKMKEDADAKDRLAMERCMRRGAICSIAEFSLLEDRLLSIFVALAAVADEFGKALMTAAAVEFQPLDISPDPYISITDK